MIDKEIRTLETDRWLLRFYLPENARTYPLVCMLHGWTGDENSMWVFASKVSENLAIISPRGLFPSSHSILGGYSWIPSEESKWSPIEEFLPSVETLRNMIATFRDKYLPENDKLILVGFSQGAALSLAYSIHYPEQVSKLASLSGFFPSISEKNFHLMANLLSHLDVLVTHGTQDEIVPVEKAYEIEQVLQKLGANVRMCISDSGHKLNATCFKVLGDFIGEGGS